MPGKEKVAFVRSKDFESIDEELGNALNLLEEANDRVSHLLETEVHAPRTAETPEEAVAPSDEQTGPVNEETPDAAG